MNDFNTVQESSHVYVLLSETQSKFGRIIRKVTGAKYNHASIAFDRELRQLYSFARKKRKVPLVCGIVREYPERFSLRLASRVNVKLFRIPVTDLQFARGRARILEIERDGMYIYNLFSALSYPVLHGFPTYKAYTCSEFVTHLLIHMGVLSPAQPPEQVTPEQLGELLAEYAVYEGDLLTICQGSPEEAEYFCGQPDYLRDSAESVQAVLTLIYRFFRYGVVFNDR